MRVGDHPTDREAKEAAKEITDADTLLPGELHAAVSDYLEDARTWHEVYEELFLFKQQVLATLLKQRETVQELGQHEVQNDEILLTREADRLARRLEFWQGEVERRSRA